MAFVEDISIFFDPVNFGVEATYTPSGGTARTVYGYHEKRYLSPLDVTGAKPVFICSAADVSAEPEGGGGGLVVQGSTYVIKHKEPDLAADLGIMVLVLQEQ
jgi:hypothetical protein